MNAQQRFPQAAAGEWSPLRECVAVCAWTSFLAASAETMVFFAYFDPMQLGADELAPGWLSLRPVAYAAGFFLFWAFTLFASALTAYMLRSRPHE